MVVAVVAATASLVLGVYPHAAAWLNEVNQTQAAQNYITETRTNPRDDAELQLAHQYNQALTMGVDLQANTRIPTSTGSVDDPGLDYASLLNSQPSNIMARLRIESIGVDLPIYHGTSDDTLLKGAGHLQGSSLPVGGAYTHAVITAHRGLVNATMFDDLPELKVGDTFTIEVYNEVLTYEVVSAMTVEPSDTEALRITGPDDLVTLVTCTPLGINSHRILVTGQRILPTPQHDIDVAGQPLQGVPGFPWWAVVSVAGLVVIGLIAWRLGLDPQRSPARD